MHEGAENALVHLFYVGLNIVQIVLTDGSRQLLRTSKPKYVSFGIKSDSRISKRRKTHTRSHNKQPRITPWWYLKRGDDIKDRILVGKRRIMAYPRCPSNTWAVEAGVFGVGGSNYKFCSFLSKPN